MVGSKIGKQLRGIRNEKDTNLGGEGNQVADRSTWMIALDHLESVTGNFIQGSQISFEARPIWEAL